MDRQAIVEQVTIDRYFGYETCKERTKCVLKKEVEKTLDAAGYFDLLKAAERVDFVRRTAIAKGIKIPHEHDCFRELEEALRKAGVYVE